jgi:hypothetical protein
MKNPLQSTIPFTADDWHIGRFSLVRRTWNRFATTAARDAVTARDQSPAPAAMTRIWSASRTRTS